ncbi:MAG TPA: alkaline phosphatase D family protein [Longimicrobium sp.]|nr:alkaline phosphatase D family protein [Longimicrobium sp.]
MANSLVFGPWSGGVTSSSAQVVVAVGLNDSVAVAFSDRRGAGGELVQPRAAQEVSNLASAPSFSISTFQLSGLLPDTEYHYDVLVGGAATPAARGRLKSFPREGHPASFRIVASGDAKTGSDHAVFDAIRAENPLLFVHLGDLHYEDIHDKNGVKYIRAYRRVLSQPRQAALYRDVPIAYTWDDHDYSHNNATSEAIGRIVARQMYVACVPHYPITEAGFDRAIYQTFTIGRVRFLLSDCRSERAKTTTMLGSVQKEALKEEMLRGRDEHGLVVWINTIPWIAAKGHKGWDQWPEERAEIAEFITQNKINNLCMLSADAHMLAIDDGSNNRPPNAGGGFPIFQASPLDRSGSIKGGPYSHGPIEANGGQYGVMEVTDDGKTVKVRWEGKRVGKGVLLSHEFTAPRS